ncbi:MAG: replication initiation protein [Peptostreptococcaceae bacterium]
MNNSENKILMKHNNLVKGKYDTSINSNRVFTYLLYSFQRNTTDGQLELEIPRDELSKLVNGNSDKTIQGIRNILSSLKKKELFLIEEKANGSKDYVEGSFINDRIYNDLSDTFTITASKRIHDLLHKYLKDGYTPINLEIWLSLKNRYAQRFYDLLRVWTGSKEVISYKVDYIREILLLENKYKQYSDFRKRVLDPAIEELNDTGLFEITYKENRVGRSVNSIDFIVKDLDKRKYFNKNSVKEVIEYEKNGKNNELDKKEDEKGINTLLERKEMLKIENKDFYVPDETVFTKGTLRSFKLDFDKVNFKDEYMLKAFNKAVMITLDRDDVETIKAISYDFFKGTLENKIVEYEKEREADIKHKEEIVKYW